MALNLIHQTAAQFAARFWDRVLFAQQTRDKVLRAKLIAWLLARITAGDLTDAQARTSFNTAFNRTLNTAQWTTFKTTTLQPIADRYNATQAEGEL